jgi:hypothetical protein
MTLAGIFLSDRTDRTEDVKQHENENPSETQLRDDIALLHIYRRGSMKGAMISYTLHLDDEAIFKVKNNAKTTVSISAAGTHTLWAKTESKTEIPIDIQPGKEYYIRCGIKFGFFVGKPKIEIVDNQTGKTEFR